MESGNIPPEHVRFEQSNEQGVYLVFSDEILNILNVEAGEVVHVEIALVEGSDLSFRINFDDLSVSEEHINATSQQPHPSRSH